MTVECFHTVKGYHLGIKDIFADWYADGSTWRRLTDKRKDSEEFIENYEYEVASTSDLLSMWCEYLPGVNSFDDYGEFTIEITIDDVEAAGWDEARLVNALQEMANKVNRCRKIEAHDAPWLTEATDAYGHTYNYWRHPALVPLSLMLDKDYPGDVHPTGDRRP